MRTAFVIPVLCFVALASGLQAQLSLSSAVNLALQNSPKVRMAQADVDKARAGLQETRDAFIPSIGASGGIGKSTGPPLAVPQVFTVSAQSLVFNFSEKDYLRAAHASLAATQLALEDNRNAVIEDVVSTYIGLDNALERLEVSNGAQAVAERLETIEQGRFDAGVDAHVEVTRAHRTGLQIQRQALNTEDDIESLSEHLSNVVGLHLTDRDIVHGSVPATFPQDNARAPDSPALRSAAANALSKMYFARAQARYLLRPQFSFGANYSYVSTAFTDYSNYYGLFTRGTNNTPNALSFGVQLQIPFVDFAHRARARGAAADAAHAQAEVDDTRIQLSEGNRKAMRARKQLALTAELAHADRDLAQDDLNTVLLQLQPGAPGSATGGQQLSPKDEQNARLQVQQKTLDMLNAELQLQQAEVTLMRQDGTLAGWVLSSLPSIPSSSTSVVGTKP